MVLNFGREVIDKEEYCTALPFCFRWATTACAL